MLARGVKPFVELSFMPGGLASGKNTAFWAEAISIDARGELTITLPPGGVALVEIA
jgi:hypothetical protein